MLFAVWTGLEKKTESLYLLYFNYLNFKSPPNNTLIIKMFKKNYERFAFQYSVKSKNKLIKKLMNTI